MREADIQQDNLFSTAIPDERAPKDEDGSPSGGGRNPTVDFRGEKRSRDTHVSKTDKDAYLFKKTQGAESKLAYLGHILVKNRHGLVVGARVTQATGTAEREANAVIRSFFSDW